jgi:hypothetical protein
MTIEVNIHNKDDKLTVEVHQLELNRDTGQWRNDVVPTKIAPNCSATFHVYHLRDLRVKEAIPMPVSTP